MKTHTCTKVTNSLDSASFNFACSIRASLLNFASLRAASSFFSSYTTAEFGTAIRYSPFIQISVGVLYSDVKGILSTNSPVKRNFKLHIIRHITESSNNSTPHTNVTGYRFYRQIQFSQSTLFQNEFLQHDISCKSEQIISIHYATNSNK